MPGGREQDDGERREHRHQQVRLRPVARGRAGVDGQRHGVRPPGDVAREHQGGPELADGAGEGQHDAGEDALPGQGQDHVERGLGPGVAQHGRGVDHLGVHRLDGRLGGTHHDGEGDHGRGDHGRLPGEQDVPPRPAVEASAQKPVAAEQQKQVVARDRGRQNHGEQERGLHQALAPEPRVGQGEGCEQAGCGDEGGGEEGDLQREQQRAPAHRNPCLRKRAAPCLERKYSTNFFAPSGFFPVLSAAAGLTIYGGAHRDRL